MAKKPARGHGRATPKGTQPTGSTRRAGGADERRFDRPNRLEPRPAPGRGPVGRPNLPRSGHRGGR